MSIYLQQLADFDDLSLGTGMVSPVPTQAHSEFSPELHPPSVHQWLLGQGSLAQCTQTRSVSSPAEAILDA